MKIRNVFVLACFLIQLFFCVSNIFGHCDTMDGPVVKAAQEALETGNVNYVLIWVEPNDEERVRRAFDVTLNARKYSPEAKNVADMSFFQILVEAHRLGEGEEYSGIKPAGTDLGPAVVLAEKAIAGGSVEELLSFLGNIERNSILKYYNDVIEKKNYNLNDLASGRAYVKAYGSFLRYVERLYGAHAGNGGQESPDGFMTLK